MRAIRHSEGEVGVQEATVKAQVVERDGLSNMLATIFS
jgi:hypothetical protein